MKNYGKEGRKGDVGLTSCNGGYIEKTNSRIVLLGKLDSLRAKILTSSLSISKIERDDKGKIDDILKMLCDAQKDIFNISSFLSVPKNVIEYNMTGVIEEYINQVNNALLNHAINWFTPHEMCACMLNEARTVCRETEIAAWDASIGNAIPTYLNRLSDLLFYLSIHIEFIQSNKE